MSRRACGWEELRCGGEATKPAGEELGKPQSKQLGFDQEYDDKEGREKGLLLQIDG